MAGDLFRLVGAGKIKIEPSKVFALRDAAEAHRELEARKTTGSIILVP
jgi:NADPH2:quinone reductase